MGLRSLHHLLLEFFIRNRRTDFLVLTIRESTRFMVVTMLLLLDSSILNCELARVRVDAIKSVQSIVQITAGSFKSCLGPKSWFHSLPTKSDVQIGCVSKVAVRRWFEL
jgi:hypothetical protein